VLGHLATGADMVVIDLTAADVRSTQALARNLQAPARRFDRAGRCLLLVGASPDLTAELDRTSMPVVTLSVAALFHMAA
jgi:hypothetical protein